MPPALPVTPVRVYGFLGRVIGQVKDGSTYYPLVVIQTPKIVRVKLTSGTPNASYNNYWPAQFESGKTCWAYVPNLNQAVPTSSDRLNYSRDRIGMLEGFVDISGDKRPLVYIFPHYDRWSGKDASSSAITVYDSTLTEVSDNFVLTNPGTSDAQTAKLEFRDSGVTAGTYSTGTATPGGTAGSITVDAKGLVTAITAAT